MKTSSHFRSIAVLAVAALAVGACSSDKKTSTSATTAASAAKFIDTSLCKDYQPTGGISADKTIKIGTVLPETGNFSIYKPLADGLAMYVRYINGKGGIKAADGNTYKLELARENDEYDPAKTLAKVQKLVSQDKIFAMVGQVGTENNLASRDTLDQDCVPSIAVATGSTEWGKTQQYRWLISGLPSYATEAHTFMEYLKKQKPNATIAVLYQNDDFGKAYLERIKKDIVGTQLKLADSQPYDPATEPTAEAKIVALAKSKADVLFMGIGGLPCPLGLKFIPADWKPMTYVSIVCSGGTAMKLAGAKAEGLYSTQATYDPSNPDTATKPQVKEYLDAGAAQGISTSDLTGGIVSVGWGFGALFAKAVETAKTVTRADVMDAVFHLKNSPFGLIRDDVHVNTNGVEDPWGIEDLAVIHREGTKWADAAPVISSEGKSNSLAG